MISTKAVPVPVDTAVARRIGEETIVVNGTGDFLHTLNETGSFIWSLIDGKRSLGEILALMEEEYDLPDSGAEAELAEFVQGLAQREMVRIVE